ncbi:shikimate kinase [Gloeobacter kilaueensis]|uniref:Shikimate kinase n=1 Tax=Gloeobacter kilaueensis (strain ATCC BAA-2537 / CCAP 1431/1 / ULC 316 / JS1) TaxID=1183438 RepID=U5QD83_GLOK1|nr:shikimate kinase [Gloeobacter kilaueensis]AGY56877.1 shikimate kinase [Gloeobacter kilaueensis JS1]
MFNGVSVFLVGMMGAGKSTVGRLLAQRLGYQFLDLDELIEQIGGSSISDIFAQQGEAAFRDLESRVLAEVCAYTRLVVATGGGVVTERRNWSYLHHGLIVWLDAEIETLKSRVAGAPGVRPLLAGGDTGERLAGLLAQRATFYAQADVRVPSEASPAEVVDLTLAALALRLKEDADG